MKYKAVPVDKFWKLAHSTRPDLFGKAFLLVDWDGELTQEFGYAMTRKRDDGTNQNWFDSHRQGGSCNQDKIKFVIIKF